MSFSAVAYNDGPLELIAYPENDVQQQLVKPVYEGWSFEKWIDADGVELLSENLVAGKKYYASWVDRVSPKMTLECTKNTTPSQDVTMLAEDIASQIFGYYVGLDNPSEIEVPYIENNAGQHQVKIEEPGVYYFSVIDTSGNANIECLEFFQVSFVTGEDETAICESMIGKAGDMLVLPEAEKRGHTLVGWVVVGEGTEEERLPIMEHTFMGEATFTPVFTPNQYQIYLDGNGGSSEVTTLEVTFGGSYPKLPDASRTGYHFLGWTLEKDGELLPEDAVYDVDGDCTLYAKWEPIQYTIRYIGNGSTEGEMEALVCTYDQEFVHPRNRYTKEGYVFKGWSTSPGAISTQNALTARDRSYNGAEWLNEDRAVNITAEADAVINLYAVWQKIEVGVMDYRYCMGEYMYFACTTLNYKTENSADNGALFVGITPAGEGMLYGSNAIWETSAIRSSLNDENLNDMTGLKTTDTTVNYSYAGMMWQYNPTMESPCTKADRGYGTKIVGTAVSNKTATEDYIFIPDLRDCYNYYQGNSWNWFWDINLDGTPDTYTLVGMSESGESDEYYNCIEKIRGDWAGYGWTERYWLRNQYTGWSKYPFYITQYGVSACNPTYAAFGNVYGNLGTQEKYLVRPMYTMAP